ncbi:acyl carrier protein (plasmid) [Gemmobacter fulvus]|uniref:Acyl carrier protein n=1 Tax=Gemmobacter fulvus TaxID=2840474 RepID=A0A975PBC0_9RHOB|nr:phosphopantetheine-binding protein [Gemmobacter fulvus]MBT9245961.1 acyl carrier protein [Gemmobacter fulvus]QWK92266.1 acyl carrier protein [Gemmobacter fulvus]
MTTPFITAIETALTEVVGRPVTGLVPETRFDRDLDLDSYMFVQFLLALEDQVPGLRFDPEAIGQHEFNLVSSLCDYIAQNSGAQTDDA